MAKIATRDAYMNWKDTTVTLDGADSSVLVEEEEATGLSIRGGLVWLLHLLEVFIPIRAYATPLVIEWALSTVRGLAAMPSLGDGGLIARGSLEVILTTNGVLSRENPTQLRWLPPVPLAAPNIALYAQTDANEAAYLGVSIGLRLGFTTAPLDAAMYTEIAETWGW